MKAKSILKPVIEIAKTNKLFILLLISIIYIPDLVNAQSKLHRRDSSDSAYIFSLPADTVNEWVVCEKNATFKSGTINTFVAFIQDSLRYPMNCVKNKVQGSSVIQFTVDYNGNVTAIRLARTSGSNELDQEALRVVSIGPKWVPGLQGGKRVNQLFIIPISFRLQ